MCLQARQVYLYQHRGNSSGAYVITADKLGYCMLDPIKAIHTNKALIYYLLFMTPGSVMFPGLVSRLQMRSD